MIRSHKILPGQRVLFRNEQNGLSIARYSSTQGKVADVVRYDKVKMAIPVNSIEFVEYRPNEFIIYSPNFFNHVNSESTNKGSSTDAHA